MGRAGTGAGALLPLVCLRYPSLVATLERVLRVRLPTHYHRWVRD